MNNLAWSGEVSQGWLTMTYLKNSESMMINVNNVGDMTEEILQGNYDDMLSDRDVMLGLSMLIQFGNQKIML
jgi:hypothetical protein